MSQDTFATALEASYQKLNTHIDERPSDLDAEINVRTLVTSTFTEARKFSPLPRVPVFRITCNFSSVFTIPSCYQSLTSFRLAVLSLLT